MGDHLVLRVDRLVTPSTSGTLPEPEVSEPSRSCIHGSKPSGPIQSVQAPEEEPLLRTRECRICQEEDNIKNSQIPCACTGSLKLAQRKCVQSRGDEKGDITCGVCHQSGFWEQKLSLRLENHEMGEMVEAEENECMVQASSRDSSSGGVFPPLLRRKVVSEIITTFLLVFITCGAAGLHKKDPKTITQLGASVAGGLIVTVMIYAAGHISGAHMNPAVTIAFAATRHFPWKEVPFYAAAQLTGSIWASFVLRQLLDPIKDLGTTTPSGTVLQALITEVIVTFNMMFVTCAVATDAKAVGELAGIAVGSAVTLCSIFAGPISGGSMNPARTLGPAVASNIYKGLWVYFLGPPLGTLLGAWSYAFIRDGAAEKSDESPSFKLRRLKVREHGFR